MRLIWSIFPCDLVEGVVAEEALLEPRLGSVMITGLACDGRQVCPGDLFLARRGRHYHGLRFIGEALAPGGAAVLYDPEGMAVPGLTARLSIVADRFTKIYRRICSRLQ